MRSFAYSHEKVIRLDVPMQKMSAVDVFDPFYHHIEEH